MDKKKFKKYYIVNFNISMYVYDLHKMVILQRSFNDSVIHKGRERTPEMSEKYIYGKKMEPNH